MLRQNYVFLHLIIFVLKAKNWNLCITYLYGYKCEKAIKFSYTGVLGTLYRQSNITCTAPELRKLEAFPNYTGTKHGYFTDAKLLLAGMNEPSVRRVLQPRKLNLKSNFSDAKSQKEQLKKTRCILKSFKKNL